MSSFNKVILLGNLTRDPEIRTIPNGLNICKFGLAMSRKFKTQSGEEKEEVTFVDVDAYGKQGEIINRYLKKGSPLHVEGRLRLDQWDAADGTKRQKVIIALEHFTFLPKNTDSAEA